MNVDKTVAKVLWSFSRADGGASAIMRDLFRNPLLTPEEHRRAERLAVEETAHSDMSEKWARALGMDKMPGYDPYSAIALRDTMVIRRVADPTLKTAWTLAGLRWNEEQSVRAFPRWLRLFDKMGRPDLVRDFTQLTNEERDHVAFGVAAAKRLAGAVPSFDATYDHYYTLTAHAGVGILSATFASTLKRLEAAVDGKPSSAVACGKEITK